MGGWIKTHRKIMDHWLVEKPEQFVWWMDILFETNYEDKEWVVGDQVFMVKRGECLYSLETWAKRWKIDKSAVRRFLIKLQKCNMIEYRNETVTTRISVCNYATYQHNSEENETHLEQERNANETHLKPTKERKNVKNNTRPKPTEKKATGDAIWYELVNLWRTEEDPNLLNGPTKKKYFDKLSTERQQLILDSVKRLGTDVQYLKNVWIGVTFKNENMNEIFLLNEVARFKKASKYNDKINKANKDTTHNFSGKYE
jgi:hypothetical protein